MKRTPVGVTTLPHGIHALAHDDPWVVCGSEEGKLQWLRMGYIRRSHQVELKQVNREYNSLRGRINALDMKDGYLMVGLGRNTHNDQLPS